jgi:hypothetical protein
MASAYRFARRNAAIETDMAEDAFPAQCPWNFAREMDEGFWPGGSLNDLVRRKRNDDNNSGSRGE